MYYFTRGYLAFVDSEIRDTVMFRSKSELLMSIFDVTRNDCEVTIVEWKLKQ